LPGKIVHIGNRVTELRADGVTYRLRTGLVEVGGLGTQYLAVGVPLTDMNATLTRLLWLELAIGTLALAAAAAIGWRLVRVAMKPLEHIEATAGAIAEGDLTQRVADEDRSTEVGRLGHSLNVMLGRIEESFAEREASEKRLRQFVADASHELQTPLTSVRGYAELFRRGAVDRPEDLANAMRRIEAESERMGVLVDDLLLLARLDQGRPLIRERVDLGAAARELAGDAQIVSQDHPIDVTVDGDVTITGDGVRLRQIISNLLSNARTHTPPGTAITVSVRRMGRDVLLEVADTGPGLSSGHLERVFERFFRADPSRARTSGGTGLGLSIVAAIARAHGGEAGVASAPGDGATFHVRLPVDGPSEPVDQLQLPEDDEQAETPS
jgi:two-component system OmpR family sensor kinase